MSKIKNFFYDWNLWKSLLVVGIGFGVLFGIMALLGLSAHFLKLVGGAFILGGVVGFVVRLVRKGFKGSDRITSIMLTIFFAAMVGLGTYLMFL